jgi:H+/Cl- antiporter ClcA
MVQWLWWSARSSVQLFRLLTVGFSATVTARAQWYAGELLAGVPMNDPSTSGTRLPVVSTVAHSALAGAIGGAAAAAVVVATMQLLKLMLAAVSSQGIWVLIVAPMLGLSVSVLVLYGFGLSTESQSSGRPRWAAAWRSFPPNTARADLTGEVVDNAGEEEHFPWRLAAIRLVAIFATVGMGAAMGTEAPAAYLGEAIGAALGSRRWQRIVRPAAVGGAAAGVSALIGIPLVGTLYILELGRRRRVPFNVERVTAALVGGLVGWLLHVALAVDLLRVVVPKEPPHSLYQAIVTALLIGVLSGSITSIAGATIYRAKAWQASPIVRLVVGGLVLGADIVLLALIAAPSAAIGPGGGAITWVETATHNSAITVLVVAILRAVATTSSAAAGGCGGLFVPYLAIGDLGGRVFAVLLGVPSDLAGAAGAAAGISGGYHLPLTAIALVLGQGGPVLAMLTCLATVVVAGYAGRGAASLADRVLPGSPHYSA